ncbi:MAG: hypothetical protein A2452_13430 [Candidatus Firestonebacteria bacterium RIFOXYC2_FULL_39_67]|nr:MAG: hypothetical protein A2536_05280 [Candidatus Firestonebacteria bacterium RIFOXYD2_FULL_39_29]OGF56208.1 MAG: hypothetical protein A2452_13430 [Candidatus Firestonebacteria bacterium RIFOXYC2_FULL_39_67]OGF57287.1 MAG: hypothetical protein A2497_03660 [Candidatus Firestonebacteria bacterium RifOxyC12_full_39_7]
MKKPSNLKYWDGLWDSPVNEEDDNYILEKEIKSIRWQRIEEGLKKHFGSIDRISSIEIGGGMGTYSAIMARNGAKARILDYSKTAIDRSKIFFEKNKVKAEYSQVDIFHMDHSLFSKFDVCMSFGLAEHFKGKQRTDVLKAHLDLVRAGGVVIISVPNKYNPFYMLYKTVFEFFGKYPVEEYPFTRNELRKYCVSNQINDYYFIGDSIMYSLNYLYCLIYRINPFVIFKKIFKIKNKYYISKIKKEKGTIIDAYFGYALVLIGKK